MWPVVILEWVMLFDWAWCTSVLAKQCSTVVERVVKSALADSEEASTATDR